MVKYYILDDDDNPIAVSNVIEWAKWFDRAYRHIGYDNIGDASVSTVFLGLNHNYFGGKPLLYETMILGGKHDKYQEQYSTKQEAMAGHQKAIELVKGGE